MDATVIDTLRFADQLKAAGFQAPQAEGMARALGDQLADRMVTRNDLKETDRTIAAGFEALEPRFEAIDARFEAIDARFEAIDARFEAIDARFEAIDARFEAIDAKFEALEPRFDAIDAKFDAMDAKLEAMDAKFETKFDALDVKIESVHREISGKFNILATVMALGFTLLVGLGTYNAVAPHIADRSGKEPVTRQQAIDRHVEGTTDSEVRTRP